MKATGIVRRIDDLGRVVIPKEIRRTMRIREGDPLEIYTDADGEVIFKKYSPVGELATFSSQYAEVLSKSCGNPIVVCDRDHVIAAAGISKKEVLERRITPQLEELMETRKTYSASASDVRKLMAIEGYERSVSIAVPIIAAGDICGAIMMLTPENNSLPTESDVKLLTVAGNFLGRQLDT